MRHAPVIAARELRAMFSTPIAYVLLSAYFVVLGYVFFIGLGVMLQQIQQIQAFQMLDMLQQFNLNERVIAPAFGTASIVLLIIVPLITMRVFAEERSQGTLELLLTSPLTVWEIVLGKYLGMLAFVALIVALSGLLPLILFLYGDPEFWQTLANLLGLFAWAASVAAFGCFASSLTQSQVVAAVVSILGALLLWLLGFAGQLAPEGPIREMLVYIAINEHFDQMLRGLIRLQDIGYFTAFIAFFLALTRARVESLRWL